MALPVIGRRQERRGDPPAEDASTLVGRLRRGDPDALAEIHRVFGGAVLGYLRGALRDGATAEDGGYLVTFAWNPHRERSEVQVFHARGTEFGRGPIARIPLPRRVPHGFHATYVSDAVMRRWP